MIPGVSETVSESFTDEQLLVAIDPHRSTVDLHGVYERRGNQVTLPVSHHLTWVAEGWTLVRLPSDAARTIDTYMEGMPASRTLVRHADGDLAVVTKRVS